MINTKIGMNMRMRTIEDDEVLSVVVEAAKKKPSKGELGMMIRMRMRRILDDKYKDWDEHEDEDD